MWLTKRAVAAARAATTARSPAPRDHRASAAVAVAASSSTSTSSPSSPTRRRLVSASVAASAPSATMTLSAPRAAAASASSGYLVPPQEILAVVDAPPQPSLSFSPDRALMLELHRPPPLPPVAELARDELKLAGVRIDAGITSRSRMGRYTGLSVVQLGDGVVVPAAEARKLGMPSAVEVPVKGLPEGCGINFVTWAKDGKRIAFTVRAVDDGVVAAAAAEEEEEGEGNASSSPPSSSKRLERGPLSLWVADVATGQARCVLENLATVLDDYAWCSETEIIALRIPENRGDPPSRPPVPLGPRIQDNSHAAKSQGRTFPDLLRDEHDDELFEYYCTSDVVKVDVVSGEVVALTGGDRTSSENSSFSAATPLHPSRLYSGISPSPDGRYLAVSWIERPFSRQFPAGRFPRVTQLWRLKGDGENGEEEEEEKPLGAFAADVARLPLADDIPIAMDSVRKGPRSLGWRADRDATMWWIEAQDGGDPSVEADPRDIVYSWDADDAAAFFAAAASSAEGGGERNAYPPSSSSSPLAPLRVAETKLRCGGVAWGDDDLALLYESRYKDRRSITWAFSPREAEKEAKVGKKTPSASAAASTTDKKRIVFDLPDYEDAYSNPGSPLLARTPRGTYVLARPDGRRALLLSGSGATPEGLVPFLDVLDLGSPSSSSSDSMTSTRLWRSTPPSFESAGSILSDGVCDRGSVKLDGLKLLLSRESADVPPQTYVATFDGVSMDDLPLRAERNEGEKGEEGEAPEKPSGSAKAKKPSAATLLVTPTEKQLTSFPHPHPSLTGAQKRVLRYERSDGVPLTATLHTPPGYDAARDGPLPIFLWLYPREFKNKEAAGQMRRSPHEFSGVGSSSPLLFLTRGYAVLDGPTFPIVAEGGSSSSSSGEKESGVDDKEKEAEPNDTYVEQLVASAEAAVAEVIRLGVAHPAKVAVGGHSYGAFTTANLLAHAGHLFACGVSRSGAYNRTLTPSGFQAEQRTIWEAPEVYAKMSAFLNADKIKKPILLVHGLADNNTGTFPIQSERMYQALISHGCPARLVELPFESHGYRGRESVLHVLAESSNWLDRWCKGAEVEEGAKE